MHAFDWPEETVNFSVQYTTYFPYNNDFDRAMLPNYLGTYYSTLCQIRALEEAFEERKKCQTYPKSKVEDACIWLARTNILLVQYPKYFFCNYDLCRAMQLNQLWIYSSALCQIWALEEAVEGRNKFQSNPKSWVFGCMHLIGQKKQSTFRCNTLRISPATMTCIEQCCQTT